MKIKKIILASASATRKKLMDGTGLPYEVIKSSYEEDMTLSLPPKELAAYLSKGKAEDVAKKQKDSIIIAADTIIVYQDKILGKPHTPERAREMLRLLSGKGHAAVTGFTIIDTEGKAGVSRSVETKIWFRDLTYAEIDEYIATGEPLDKAGAYAILDLGRKFVEKIEGSETNVAGLPMEELKEELKKFGINIF